MSEKLKQCHINNLIKVISKLSGKSISEVEDEMVYCDLYPLVEITCLRRFIISKTEDENNWLNDTLNKILDMNDLKVLYITNDSYMNPVRPY